MIINDATEVERKVLAILKALSEAREPLSARVIAQQLEAQGINLSERGVRYHLKLMDERGLTRLFGREGRMITPDGADELKDALVSDKVGFVISKIELLAFATDFDIKKRRGQVPVNISFFPKNEFPQALETMKLVFQAGLCVSDRVAVAQEGERLGGTLVPSGKIGLATVCSIAINGTLLKAGVPMDSRFGGILQMRHSKPLRFVELISYSGSSLDPSEVFIRGRMTSVYRAATEGEGKILANFREIPTLCKPLAEDTLSRLQQAGMGGVVSIGNPGEPLCETPVGVNRVGMVLLGGLNPVAAAQEMGIHTENQAMSTTMDYARLRPLLEVMETVHSLNRS